MIHCLKYRFIYIMNNGTLLRDNGQLARCIHLPDVWLTMEKIWEAYQAVGCGETKANI